MELKNLRAFVEVVRQNGFTAAGKTLCATQSTVSKAVRQIEDEIGAPLLDRPGPKPRLTSIGEAVYARALRLLAERDDLLAEIAELRGLKRGVLRLGLPPVGSGILFAPLFTRFRKNYPGIDIRLIEHGSARLEEILKAGEIDFAASLLPVDDDFEWHEIRRDPLMVLGRRRQRAGRPRAHCDQRSARYSADPVRKRLCAESRHHQRLPQQRLRTGGRGAFEPDRLHRRTGRRRVWARPFCRVCSTTAAGASASSASCSTNRMSTGGWRWSGARAPICPTPRAPGRRWRWRRNSIDGIGLLRRLSHLFPTPAPVSMDFSARLRPVQTYP